MASFPSTLCVPIKLHAFVFNEAVCNDQRPDKAKIAPITQPNYTFLRVEGSLALNDVLPHVDLHNAAPASRNSRFTDIGTGRTRSERIGVYLHWMVPRPFRRGIATSRASQPVRQTADDKNEDPSAPVFLPIPNRWLVVRTLDPHASTTKPSGTTIEAVKAWVIESDRTRYIDDILADVDLQVDVSPFITAFSSLKKDSQNDPKNIRIDEQAEVFIGQCFDAGKWSETKAQRVELTAASSSNQLFLDYQYHNGSVFSMCDTFDYVENKITKHLEAAEAHYYVLGWHKDQENDIMHLPNSPETGVTRESRLESVAIQLDKSSSDPKKIQDWLKSPESSRTICHGSLYDVLWSSKDPPTKSLANEFAAKLRSSQPLSVGTNPLDSIITYVSERAEKCTLEDNIKRLRNLLLADDETVDAHMAAEAQTEAFNAADFDGGFQYDFADDRQGPHLNLEGKAMAILNAKRHLYDNVLRRIQQIRWQLFSTWWKYVSDPNTTNQTSYAKDAKENKLQLQCLEQLAYDLFQDLKGIASNGVGQGIMRDPQPRMSMKQGTMEPFHQQSDPTLMLAGLRPGWPRDFGEKLNARLDIQLIPGQGGEIVDKVKIPPELKETARQLLQEFSKLLQATDPNEKPPDGFAFPLYHDLEYRSKGVVDENTWRDRWSASQPWFPLYIEWEAEFFQIPYPMWKFGDFQKEPPDQAALRDDCPCDPTEPDKPEKPEGLKTGYYLASNIQEHLKDIEEPRSLSGRMLILPQPTFSLQVHLDRLLSTIPAQELDKVLPECERQKLKHNLDRLQFLSAPLAGLTNHLLTLYDGTHVKPLVRVPGQKPVALVDAQQAIGDLDLDISAIDKESDPTPYGTLTALTGVKTLAFKPVTHGQLRFTKLNVVDKFGQVVHAIDPLKEDSTAIHPSLSYYYKPQQISVKDKTPNVVDPDKSRSPSVQQSEFVQIPPCINQPARWNADFVVHDDSIGGLWRPATRLDKPIWGWMIVNYVDRGLQFFTGDGDFFREVRITQGKNGSTNWLPFPAPSTADLADTAQLSHFIDRIIKDGDNDYICGVMAMVDAAIENAADAPSAYGQFLNSLVGKPLAMVNMGWSLELSTSSLKNQSTLKAQQEAAQKGNRALGLLPDDALAQYRFSLKLGDNVQSHDGLVGYFKAKSEPDQHYDDLDLDTIYTHYSDEEYANLSPVSKTDDETGYPAFKATWIDPCKLDQNKPLQEKAEAYERQRNGKLRVFGAILDPFRPVHGFSGILPLRSLVLPTWAWESSLKRMTTFFHAGPMLVHNTLPKFDKDRELTRIDKLEEKFDEKSSLGLPALQIADWAWLQPYQKPKPNVPRDPCGKENPSVPKDPLPAFMPLGIQKADTVASLPRGPYTATEGYMLLRAPLERNKNPKQTVNDDVDADFEILDVDDL